MFVLAAEPSAVWAAIRDVGEVHRRLARGFVTNTELDGDVRTVTFSNGVTARERLVTVDDEQRRLVYTVVGGRASHHNASFEVLSDGPSVSRVIWTTDVLPDDAAAFIDGMMEQGVNAMRATLGTGDAESSGAVLPRVRSC
jgi:carbon monoxide dehydrogenase subunit G